MPKSSRKAESSESSGRAKSRKRDHSVSRGRQKRRSRSRNRSRQAAQKSSRAEDREERRRREDRREKRYKSPPRVSSASKKRYSLSSESRRYRDDDRRSPRRHYGYRMPPTVGHIVPNKKLCIFRLNFDTTEESLEYHFKKFGDIKRVRIIKDHQTGKSRGFGFLAYYNSEDARRAFKMMDREVIDGRQISIEYQREEMWR